MNDSLKKISLFVLAWFFLSLLQSFFTEVVDDEAYYWVYSLNLDWGYFDHPPMIALLIKIGYALFPGELGLRLIPSLLGAGTLFLVFLMLKDNMKDLRLPMVVSLSIPLIHTHVAGFLAIPDLPFVFFATLFFFFYKRYLEKESAWIIILLALSISLMLYSKYHAFLVIGFTVLSNLKLLGRKSFWLVVIISLVLYLPHIIWQIRNDFVSFGYHLVDRNAPFQIKHLLEYLGNQIVMVGPFCGIILICLGFSRRVENKFEAALKFNLVGFFAGFLFSSLKGHVEPHWTAFAIVPLLILSVPMVDQRPRLKKWVLNLSYISILIILPARFIVIEDFGILPEQVSHRFLHKEEHYLQIQEKAGNRPIVYSNSYQHPSLQWFFSKKPSFTKNDRLYRRNQYDLMDMEADLHGKKVMYFTRFDVPGADSIITDRQRFQVHYTSFFASYNRVEIRPPELDWDFEAGDMLDVDLKLVNPTDRSIYFSDSCSFPPVIVYTYKHGSGKARARFAQYSNTLPTLEPGAQLIFPVQIRAPYEPGSYQLTFGFGAKNMPAGMNGRPVRMTVHSRSREN